MKKKITVLLTFLFLKRIRVKSIIVLFSIFSLAFASIQTTSVKEFIKGKSERVYLFVYEREESARYDQSSHLRRAMVEKGLVLFTLHPFTGVGLGNFIQSDVALQLDFDGADMIRSKDLMNKSAHNSYIMLLAEGGLLLIIPVMLLFTYIIVRLSSNYNKMDEFHRAILIGFIGMCIHLFFISILYPLLLFFRRI